MGSTPEGPRPESLHDQLVYLGDEERQKLLIRDGDEALAWHDLDKWLARKQRIVEADARIAVTKQQMVSVEEVMALMGMIVSTIKWHVKDAETRRVLAREIRAAAGSENPGGAVVSLRQLPASASDTEREGDD